jgi:ActR/RegA family two-component response regulator
MLIRRLVEAQRPDWKCTEVASGEEALQIALEQVFDYATVDVNISMPNALSYGPA